MCCLIEGPALISKVVLTRTFTDTVEELMSPESMLVQAPGLGRMVVRRKRGEGKEKGEKMRRCHGDQGDDASRDKTSGARWSTV